MRGRKNLPLFPKERLRRPWNRCFTSSDQGFKLRGLRKARVMSITEVSPRLGRLDTILMIGNNFGLFANPNRARRLLRQLHHSTTPNALIIAESNDPYQTSEPFHLAYQRRNRREGKMPGELTIRVRYKKYTTPWFDYLIVSKK